MSKLEQVLDLDPAHELHFAGPFTEVSTSKLKLSNPSDSRVCFKVKTTAPKMYCVRPNSGLIEPGQNITVSVMLQPVPNYDHTEKCKHKFMVQTMLIEKDTVVDSQDALWKDALPDTLMASRLRCVFDLPEQNDLSPVEEDHEAIAKLETKFVSPHTMQTKLENDMNVEGLMDLNKHLNEQVVNLQDELNKVKAQEVRMRKMVVEDSVSSTPPPSPEIDSSSLPTSQLYVYIFIALLLGLLIGKFLL